MRAGILYMIGVVILWGIIPILVKIVLTTIDPFSIAFLRLFQGTLALLVLYRIRGGQWRALFQKNRLLLIGGAGLGINYVLFSVGLNFTTAGAAVLIIQSQVVTFAVLAAFFLGERLTAFKIAGMIAVICGMVFVVLPQNSLGDMFSSRYTLGNVMIFVAGMTWGVYALTNKMLGRQMGSFHILIPMFTIATLATGAVAATQFELKRAVSLEALAAIVVLGVLCTGGSFYLVSEGMKRLSAALVGTMTSSFPLLSLWLAHLILGEEVTTAMFVAAALIIGGILVMVYSERNHANSVGE
ncbi:MAG: DMT family transporter [Candidatus Latescibacteria bacterium]|jgi:drug/metabolite transporter (DMT)-like permease|nr:DMT family transporter [Candidatus Latescibacterota bacterium]